MPFAQLGLSADVPFEDGVDRGIPFDTVIYQSGQFGGFETEAGISVFFVPFGVYFVTLQVVVDTSPTEVGISAQVASGSAQDATANTVANQVAANASLSAVRFESEAPLPGHVLPVGVIPLIGVTGGGNGNILAASTKLFVWQLAQFQPSP